MQRPQSKAGGRFPRASPPTMKFIQSNIDLPFIIRRNINNLRYADDTTQMAEREEELESLLMRMKQESEKADLKLNIQKK